VVSLEILSRAQASTCPVHQKALDASIGNIGVADMEKRWMLCEASYQKLRENHRKQIRGSGSEVDYWPVAKVFIPWGAATFLLSELDEDGIAFGLSDLGFGTPELGYLSLDEIWDVKGPGGMTAEEDIHFVPQQRLTAYSDEAKRLGRIKA
jgi:hypothetical protein